MLDPWGASATPKVQTLGPSIARLLSESIADALCPKWRKDATVEDSVPFHWDHQTSTDVRALETELTFTWWKCWRDDSGLVEYIYVSWGDMAVGDARRNSVMSHFSSTTPIYVDVRLKESKCSVPGPYNKHGTTANRLYKDLEAAVHKLTVSPWFIQLDSRTRFTFNKK